MSGLPKFELTGRNVVHISTIFNALAITDTTMHYSSVLTNLSDYKDLFLLIRSTLNQSCVLHFYGSDAGTIYADNAGTDVTFSIPVLTVNRVINLTQNDLYRILGISLPNLMLGAGSATAPTSGSLTIDLYGSPAL